MHDSARAQTVWVLCDAPPSFPPAPLHSFSLQMVTESEVLKELLKLDPKNPSGSDGLNSFFFKVAAPIITELITGFFNLFPLTGEVPIA